MKRPRARIACVLGAAGLGVWGAVALGAAFPATLRLPRRDPARAPGLPAALFSHRGHVALG